MLGFICRNTERLSSKTQLFFLQSTILSRSLSVPPLKREHNLSGTSDFLIKSCGFSPERAKSVSSWFDLENLDNANAVIKLFQNYGLTNAHISRMVSIEPRLLRCNLNKTLVPKFQFLESVGASNSDICMILSSNPKLLVTGLESTIIPLHNTLKSVFKCNAKVFMSMRRLHRHERTFLKCLDCRLCYLQELGMPLRQIFGLLLQYPRVFASASHTFDQAVKKIIEIGCDPTKPTFATALKVMVYTKGGTGEAKLEVYRKYGLSENDFWSIFKENPRVLNPSAEVIMGSMDFLVGKMGLQPAYVARNAVVFSYSLHNRIVPRFSVIRFLRLKGLLEQDVPLSSVVLIADKKFLERFVTKYPKEAPQLLSILQRKQSIQDLGFDF